MKSSFLFIVIFATCCQVAIGPVAKSKNNLSPLNVLAPSTIQFLRQIPNLFGLCTAIKAIPHRIILQIKDFLEEIVEDIPDDNLLKFHFNNVIFLISSYKSIIDAKKQLSREFTNIIDGLESDIDEPVMFRSVNDVTKMFTNPFDLFMKSFEKDPEVPLSSLMERAPRASKKKHGTTKRPTRKLLQD